MVTQAEEEQAKEFLKRAEIRTMKKDLLALREVDSLKESAVVKHLIESPRDAYSGADIQFPDPTKLDSDRHPRDTFIPLLADSSQIAAVYAAEAGKDFVLIGPPGTGKSQTIANMISQLLATGKTVLFVSEKTAALEVVY